MDGPGPSDKSDETCAGEAYYNPDGGDTPGDLEVVRVLDSGVPDDDVGHSEVTETPCQQRYYRNQRNLLSAVIHEAGEVFGESGKRTVPDSGDLSPAPEGDDCGDGHDDQRDDHEHSLEHVGPADRLEPSEEGVGNNNCGGYDDGDVLVLLAESEDDGEHLSRSDESGCDVDYEEDQDDDCTDIPQQAFLILVTVGEEGGKGKGVL